MKYKVIFYNNHSGAENDVPLGSFSFYTKAQAVNACNLWIELGTFFKALLWDGSTWTLYQA